jgi:glutaredoxin 3
MNIVIYSKSGCPNCVTAKRLLDSKGIGYNEVDVETAEGLMSLNANVPAQYRQMPQIFIEGQRVGGLAGLQAALKELGL